MSYVIIFLFLFLNWVIWSGMFTPLLLSLGVISCAIVTFMSHDLLFKSEKFSVRHVIEFARFIKYIPWLLYQIMLSNIHVTYLVLHPKMPIEPSLVSYRTKLKKDISLVTFANSITLTPGTMTADIKDGQHYVVHALSRKTAEDLMTGDMEKRVARIFGED